VNNRKLAQLKIRRRMHEAVYNSIIYSWKWVWKMRIYTLVQGYFSK
jgi:hypothetical protein